MFYLVLPIFGAFFAGVTCSVNLVDYANWSLKKCDGQQSWKVKKPTQVLMDLLDAGVLVGDPYDRFNELEWSWVPNSCWQYSATFDLPSEFKATSIASLRFESVDTVAEIYLNGEPAMQTRSMFVPYELTLPVDKLQPEGNVLEIVLQPALEYTTQAASNYPYTTPETVNYNVWAEPSQRNQLRKVGNDFGWDWGPAYIPQGILGPITMSATPQILYLIPHQTHTTNSDGSTSVLLSTVVTFDVSTVSFKQTYDVDFSVSAADGTQIQSFTSKVLLEPSNNGMQQVSVSSMIPHAQLWWPVGYGAQNLYTITATLANVSSMMRKVGLRTTELVREEEDGSNGESFYFKINGQAIFAKGANWIPADAFQTRVSHQDVDFILSSAVAANMNMVRVWGGGTYQTEEFYAMCDEKGLMVWQEMMFACALYPVTDEFLDLVTKEVQHQLRRISSHASIVIWGGNNENEAALNWFTESLSNRDLYVADYSQLYASTILNAIRSVDGSPSSPQDQPQHPFVDSSPSNGIVSELPYAKRWGNSQDASYGDVHYYNYANDCEDVKYYPHARFVSEFGFQSQPGFLSYKEVSNEGDWSRNSEFMLYRQRHENGNAEMEAMAAKHFILPPETASSSDQQQQEVYDAWLFLAQIQQSRCYETAITLWRRLRSESAHSMGVLYWQLNDIWQGPSWSSIEFNGRWKVLHYSMRRLYDKLLLSGEQAVFHDPSSSISVYLTNDGQSNVVGDLTISVLNWNNDKQVAVMTVEDVSMAGFSDGLLTSFSASSVLTPANGCESTEDCFIKLSLSSKSRGDDVTGFVFPTAFKSSPILTASAGIEVISTSQVDDVTIQVTFKATKQHAPYVWLETSLSNVQGWFSDNAFLAEMNEEYSVTFTSTQPLDLKEFESSLSIRSLQSTLF